MDYSKTVHFSHSEAEDQPTTKLVEVSEKTGKFLRKKCTRRLPNTERKELWDHYPLPKVPATRTPQLDPSMKPKASSNAMDKSLAKVQTLVLDLLAPLTCLMEAHHNILDHKEVIQAVRATIQLVGNANAHLSHLRRESVISDFNKSLLPIVGDAKSFSEAAPFLCGTEFAKKGKEMVE